MATPTPTATVPLYIHGGGRITCAALHCAGSEAHFSGMKRDLHGARIVRVTRQYAARFLRETGVVPCCESCGAKAWVLGSCGPILRRAT